MNIKITRHERKEDILWNILKKCTKFWPRTSTALPLARLMHVFIKPNMEVKMFYFPKKLVICLPGLYM